MLTWTDDFSTNHFGGGGLYNAPEYGTEFLWTPGALTGMGGEDDSIDASWADPRTNLQAGFASLMIEAQLEGLSRGAGCRVGLMSSDGSADVVGLAADAINIDAPYGGLQLAIDSSGPTAEIASDVTPPSDLGSPIGPSYRVRLVLLASGLAFASVGDDNASYYIPASDGPPATSYYTSQPVTLPVQLSAPEIAGLISGGLCPAVTFTSGGGATITSWRYEMVMATAEGTPSTVVASNGQAGALRAERGITGVAGSAAGAVGL
jgi:hypothetical protein